LSLDAGLGVHRVRGDGQIVSPDGAVLRFQPGRRELLYLNTRVGWPRLVGERNGVVIIDRSSISHREMLRAAMEWAAAHQVRRIIVLHDYGDIEASGASDAACVLESGTLASVQLPMAYRRVASGLTLGALLDRPRPVLSLAQIEAPQVEAITAELHRLLSEARSVDNHLPLPLFAATRLLMACNTLVGRVRTYDQTSALVPRLKPLGDLARIVAVGHDLLGGRWSRFRETHFGLVRTTVQQLLSALEEDNPKFAALVYLLDDLRRRSTRPKVIVRVSNEAAAFACAEDVEWFDRGLGDPDFVQFIPYSERLPFYGGEGHVEVLAGLPPLWHRQAIWSGEAGERILLAYGWEAATLRRAIEKERQRVERFSPGGWTERVRPVQNIAVVSRYQHRQGTEAQPRGEWEIDMSSLGAEVELAEPAFGTGEGSAGTGPTAWPVMVRPVVLEPGSEVWLVPEGAEVEVLVGRSYRHLRAGDLRQGERVIVPRGTGRTTLFARAVAMVRREGSYFDADVVMGRWRRACRRVLEVAGTSYGAQQLLRDAGCTTVTQLEAWSDGSTIAPDTPMDMQRVAVLAEDDWLQRNWWRVAKLASEVRGMHIRIGQTISAAMREAADGHGDHLRELADLLQADAASLIDEFDVRIVHSVSPPSTVPSYLAGSVRSRARPSEAIA
jgi:hypothetical protein